MRRPRIVTGIFLNLTLNVVHRYVLVMPGDDVPDTTPCGGQCFTLSTTCFSVYRNPHDLQFILVVKYVFRFTFTVREYPSGAIGTVF